MSILNRLVVKAYNYISLALVQLHRFRQLRSYRLNADPKIATGYPACAHQLRNQRFGQISWDGEANPLSGGDDGGVNAHHLPVHVEQWSTRVPWINGRIGLDKVIIRTG